MNGSLGEREIAGGTRGKNTQNTRKTVPWMHLKFDVIKYKPR